MHTARPARALLLLVVEVVMWLTVFGLVVAGFAYAFAFATLRSSEHWSHRAEHLRIHD